MGGKKNIIVAHGAVPIVARLLLRCCKTGCWIKRAPKSSTISSFLLFSSASYRGREFQVTGATDHSERFFYVLNLNLRSLPNDLGTFQHLHSYRRAPVVETFLKSTAEHQ